jgi:hypothetical protein
MEKKLDLDTYISRKICSDQTRNLEDVGDRILDVGTCIVNHIVLDL